MMRFWRWLRVVLPPLWVVGLAALFYFMPILFVGIEWLLFPEDLIQRDGSVANALRRVYGDDSPLPMMKNAILLLYGAWRVIGLHPLFRTDYRRWLEATPWNLTHPLPLGPIHVAWQDVILLGGIVVIESWSNPVWHPLTPITCFLGGYLPVLAVTLRVTGLRPMDYLLAYGVGAVLLLAGHEPLACGLAVGLYGAAYWGLRRSLARFPWDRDELECWDRYRMMASNNEEQPRFSWPYDRLTADPPRVRMDLMESALLSGLVGWWVFVVFSSIVSEEVRGNMLGLALLFTIVGVPLVRVGIYGWGHKSPISQVGRLFTGRWVIPRYDVIFAAPILAVAAGSALCLVLVELGWSWWMACPPGVTITLFLAFYLGPNLDRWRLTAPARLHPTDTRKQTKI